MTSSTPTQPPLPSEVMGVHVTPSVHDNSPTLTVMWHALASGAVTYTVKYSTQPGEVNTPPEGALEVTRISGTPTILTALKRGTTYYIWVVGVSEGGEGPHSDRTSGVTYDSELGSIMHQAIQRHWYLSVTHELLAMPYIHLNFLSFCVVPISLNHSAVAYLAGKQKHDYCKPSLSRV